MFSLPLTAHWPEHVQWPNTAMRGLGRATLPYAWEKRAFEILGKKHKWLPSLRKF